MNRRELEKYQLSMGSRGQVVRVVKQLLHSNPHNSYQTDRTDIFDGRLQSAVAEFQRTARLSNTDGILNIETWTALGANVIPAQIDILSTHDSNIRSLLSGMEVEDGKPPSKEKIDAAWKSLQKCRSQAEKEYQRKRAELNEKYSAENQISILGDIRKTIISAGAGIAWEVSKASGKVVMKRLVGGAVVGTLIQTAAEGVYMTGAWFEELWIIGTENTEDLIECFESNEETYQLSFRKNDRKDNISASKDHVRWWDKPMW